MTDLVLATTEADASAAAAIEQHHAELSGALAALARGARSTAATAGDRRRASRPRGPAGCAGAARSSLPHAAAPRSRRCTRPRTASTAPAADRRHARRARHHRRAGARDRARASDAVRAAAGARALQAVFDSHLHKENELILPLLSGAPGVSLADLLGGMHELLGGAVDDEEPAGCGGHSCSCGEAAGPGYPELDARSVPHAIRHATIFGALSSVVPGEGLLLVAPHDPLPLLDQIDQTLAGDLRGRLRRARSGGLAAVASPDRVN